MQILASALPGFRDLRAPLIAGYLWLGFAWVLADPNFDRRPSSGPGATFFHVTGTLGHVGTALAASIAAYLVGSASQGLTPVLRGVWSAVLRLPPFRQILRSARGTYQPTPVYKQIEDLEREASGAGIAAADTHAHAQEARHEVEAELDLPATLLVGKEPTLFAHVDRLRAEAELRLSVVPPLLASVALLAGLTTALWLLALPLILVLLDQGYARTEESRRLIGDAMTRGLIQSLSVERFRDWINAERDRDNRGRQ